jgi:hypothetical protein
VLYIKHQVGSVVLLIVRELNMRSYRIEKLQGAYYVVRTSKFLLWTSERFMAVFAYRAGKDACLWFNTYLSAPEFWNINSYSFKDLDEAKAALDLCLRLKTITTQNR